MDDVFKALADPGRRALLDRLHSSSGLTLTQLWRETGLSRQAISKHLAVLERANLITTARKGREKRHFLNPVPIAQIARRWIRKYEERQVSFLVNLKEELEREDE